VWNVEAEPGAASAKPDFSEVLVTLANQNGVFTRSFGRGGGEKFRRRWITIGALDLIRRDLIGALDDWIE
jgi:hypothetical protein